MNQNQIVYQQDKAIWDAKFEQLDDNFINDMTNGIINYDVHLCQINIDELVDRLHQKYPNITRIIDLMKAKYYLFNKSDEFYTVLLSVTKISYQELEYICDGYKPTEISADVRVFTMYHAASCENIFEDDNDISFLLACYIDPDKDIVWHIWDAMKAELKN
jgi:hypothetical protein